MIKARLRHRVAFRTCQKEVAPDGVRLWISEPPSCAEAAEYLSIAANDIATRTNGQTHQSLDANGHPWQKLPGILCNFFVRNLVDRRRPPSGCLFAQSG